MPYLRKTSSSSFHTLCYRILLTCFLPTRLCFTCYDRHAKCIFKHFCICGNKMKIKSCI